MITVEVTRDCAEALPAELANLNPATWPDPNPDGSTTLPALMAYHAWIAIRYALATSQACRAVPDLVIPPQ